MKAILSAVLRGALRFRGVLAAAMWVVLTLAVASGQHGEGSDDAVIGSLGGLALPLVAFAFVSATLFGGSLRAAAGPLVRLGASPLHALVALFAVPVGASALTGGALGLVVVGLTRSPSSVPFDMWTTAWVAALGGAAYAALFVATSSLGKNGGGRSVALALDFVLGASSGLFGVLTLRGHVRNLLGGIAPLELGQRASSVVLLLVVFAGFAVARARLRPREARLKQAAAIDRAAGA